MSTHLAPRDLDKKHQGIYRETLKILQKRKAPTFEPVTDIPWLDQYVRSLYHASEALSRILAREKVYEDWQKGIDPRDEDDRKYPPPRGWTAFGAQGQLVQHPDVKTRRENLHDANDVAKELLLPPKTRKQFEIESGAGDDKDDPFA